jgi:glucokinase
MTGVCSARYIVMSGLPASGKSRLGREISRRLGLPFLDKDDFLEELYEREGAGNKIWRERLSREADDLFRAAALASKGAVLASFWRHPRRARGGGTPSEWLKALPGTMIEVHCSCPPKLALERFRQRTRHPGHLDAARDTDEMHRKFEVYAARGPLGLDAVIPVEMTEFPDADEITGRVRWMLLQGSA